MNNARRKQIRKAHSLLMQAQEIIDQCAFEESECFDNLPESIQLSERGMAIEETANELDRISTDIEYLAEELLDQI